MPILRDLFARQQGSPAEERSRMVVEQPLGHWLAGSADSGMTVTPETALSFSAVLACIRILSESVAMLPLILYEREGAGRHRAADDPRYRLLHDSPNPEMTAYEFLEFVMVHLLQYGNAYAEIEIDDAGRPVALWPLLAQHMTLYETELGLVYHYQYRGSQWFPAERILHVHGVGSNGYTGFSPITLARQQIGLGMAAESFGARLFANDATPSAVLEYPGKLTPEAIKNIRTSWEKQNAGLTNAHRVAVIEEGMKYNQMSMPPEDVQFLQLRRFQVEEIARIYRVPPHMLADLERATFSNIEHQGQSFVTYSLMPWLRRIEQRANKSLLMEREKPSLYWEFMVDALQRGDLTTRTQAYATMINWGVMSPNEARRRENLNDQPDGDQFLMPLNMTAAGGDGEDGPDGRSGRGEARSKVERRSSDLLKVMTAHMPVFEETMTRVCRRQAQDVAAQARKRLGQRGRGDFMLWLEEFWRDHAEWMTAAVLPLYRTYGELVVNEALRELPDDAAGEWSPAWIESYVEQFVSWHVAKSQRKIEAALRQEDSLGAVEAATAVWLATWPEYLANRETVLAGNELSRQTWQANGSQGLEWVTGSLYDNCYYCQSMNGAVIPINGQFAIPNLPGFRSVKVPPVHDKCQCTVRPVWVMA